MITQAKGMDGNKQVIFFLEEKKGEVHCLHQSNGPRAANNSRSSDDGRPKFPNVQRNSNLGRTFCPANFLLQHLIKSFTNII